MAEKFKKGDTVVINDKAPAHLVNDCKGQIGTIIYRSSNCGGDYRVKFCGKDRYVKSSYLDLITKLKITSRGAIKDRICDLITRKDEITEQIATEHARIAFMDEIGSDEYDEDLFQAYQVLDIVEEEKTSKIEKAKKIVSVFRK